MAIPGFENVDPTLEALQAESVARQARITDVVTQYRSLGYLFFTDSLAEGDTVHIHLPAATILEDMDVVAAPRVLAGEVTSSARALLVDYDSGPDEINLTGETIVPGGWGNLTVTVRGGYFPQMLSDGLSFGYHILGEGRANAENLMVPFSHLAVNGTVIFNQPE